MRNIERLLSEKYYLADAPVAAKDIGRILQGEPLDYVIGWAPFLGCTIDLSLRPFIPRPETEYWVGELIKRRKSHRAGKLRVLDMFAGSGCVGIAILKHLVKSHVTFAEKDQRFIAEIKINLEKNGISQSRFDIVRSDLFKRMKGRFDLIAANPPYVGHRDLLDPEVKKWEPPSAYYGGPDGLSVIRRFLKDAKKYLVPGGELWIEFGSRQQRAIQKLVRRFGYERFTFHRDQYQRPRYVVMQKTAGGFVRHIE